MVEAKSGMKKKDRLPPIHPGEILREEFPSPPGMPSHRLAMALRVPATRVNEIRYNLAIAEGFAATGDRVAELVPALAHPDASAGDGW